MDRFGVNQGDLARILGKLRDIDRKAMPDVTRWALNDMAFAVHDGNKDLMRRNFDRPTPFTLNAFFVRKATRTVQEAEVRRKDFAARRHYLEVQNEGGRRRQTGVERLFTRRLKYEGLINAVVPTRNIRKNRYGNVAPGTLQRILSGVQAQGDRAQNTTAASRARAKGRRAEYFVPSQDSKLSPGVYERRGRGIRKMLAFTESVPTYKERFPMERHAAKVAANEAPGAVERALKRALASI